MLAREVLIILVSHQMMCTAVILGCGVMLAGLSLMGLSRGVQEEQNYRALAHTSMTCTTEDVRHECSPELEPSHSSLNRGIVESLTVCMYVCISLYA